MLSTEPRELREAAGLSIADASRLFSVSARTIRRYEASGAAPLAYLDALHARAYGLPLTSKGWRGWRFLRGCLVSPEGEEFTPGRLRAQHFERQLLATLRRQFDRFCREPRQLELWPGVDFSRPRAGR